MGSAWDRMSRASPNAFSIAVPVKYSELSAIVYFFRPQVQSESTRYARSSPLTREPRWAHCRSSRLLLQSRAEPGAPPARCRPPALGEAPEAPSARPDLLGLAFPPVAGLAVESSRPPLAECLDHVLVINEAHLRRVLREYYHDSRPHQSLEGNAPRPREIESASQGRIVAEPQVGGLHHRYRRASSLWICTPRPVGQPSDQRSGRKACRRIRIAGWSSHPSAHRWPVCGDGFGPR